MDTVDQIMKEKKESAFASVKHAVKKTIAVSAILYATALAGDMLDATRPLERVRYRNAIIAENGIQDPWDLEIDVRGTERGLETYLVNAATGKELKIYKDGHTRRVPDELKAVYQSFKEKTEGLIKDLYIRSKVELEKLSGE